MSLRDFILESNRIEGIQELRAGDIDAHRCLLGLDYVRVADLEKFVRSIQGKPLRRAPGMDVRVGNYLAPPGGEEIETELAALLDSMYDGDIEPLMGHKLYESLHPFLDGNGRSGRALWAWQMARDGLDPFSLPFLHRFYYQVLDATN